MLFPTNATNSKIFENMAENFSEKMHFEFRLPQFAFHFVTYALLILRIFTQRIIRLSYTRMINSMPTRKNN